MNARSKGNPFARSQDYWVVTFTIAAAAARTADESFSDLAISVADFETDEARGIWTFELLCSDKPDMAEIQRRLYVLSTLHNVPLPKPEVKKLVQQDWLKQVARDFPALSIGRFYVHGAHVAEKPPGGSVDIQVDAGAAFGSGEHGTTRCCLMALDWLARKREFRNILDMGSGSGILAIAAAKIWQANVLASDIDPVAVRVAAENARINRVQSQVTCIESDGYASARIKRGGPFDLIVSNILARPLIAFSSDLAAHLRPGGMAVLSGLLTSQETLVLSAHMMQGLKLERRFVHGQWSTLLLRK